MELCIVCAYPSTPVLSGVWRTCGLMQRARTSLQIPAIQRHEIRVDKNLYGVSGQVTAPGVLAFHRVFPALRAGKSPGRHTPRKQFARKRARDPRHRSATACPLHNEARRRPIMATTGNGQMPGA